MKRNILVLAALAALPSIAAADNVGSCGWGSKLFEGKRGVAYQVLAVTTNGTLGNQTFGISSGTSGCTQDGVVSSSWKTAAFIDGNMNKLALDTSRGQGESLAALASLLKVKEADTQNFNIAMQKNFTTIFAKPEVTSTEVAAAVKQVLADDAALAQYSTNV